MYNIFSKYFIIDNRINLKHNDERLITITTPTVLSKNLLRAQQGKTTNLYLLLCWCIQNCNFPVDFVNLQCFFGICLNTV